MLIVEYDELSLDGSPTDEDGVQVTPAGDYAAAMLAECRRYRDLLERYFGEPPEGAMFLVRGHPHDFGTYYEVEVRYEVDNPDAVAYAFRCEANLPARWDSTPPATWR